MGSSVEPGLPNTVVIPRARKSSNAASRTLVTAANPLTGEKSWARGVCISRGLEVVSPAKDRGRAGHLAGQSHEDLERAAHRSVRSAPVAPLDEGEPGAVRLPVILLVAVPLGP